MNITIKDIIANKTKLFWNIQISGWIIYCIIKIINGYTFHDMKSRYLYTVLIGAVAGFIITTALRYLYRFVRNLPKPRLSILFSVILLIPFSAALLSYVELWSFIEYYVKFYDDDYWAPPLMEYFTNISFNMILLISWSALYFATNFYFMFSEKEVQYAKANALAHQAQLKMLRYQLNPHFLFNTLNAISTLVLDQQTKEANNMLTKLSAFLRFSLVSQPNQKTTLSEELYALYLYLDIEKIRFVERLKLNFTISDGAKKALVPSLILQPLVENAIKYAIATMEEGGTIKLDAYIKKLPKLKKGDNDLLVIILEDNGPGLSFDNPEMKKTSSSGVGIANTRERLSKLYPATHSFTVESNQPQGLRITITLPAIYTDDEESNFT